MPALVGWIVVTLASGGLVAWLTRWDAPPRAPRESADPADTARKLQSVMSSLAGFAVTSIVLLITLSGGRLDPTQERTISLIALLVVAYLGFVVGGIMLAHLEPTQGGDGAALQPVLYGIASSQFYRSIVSGWFALGPLVAIVGSATLTDFVLFWLLVAVLGGWILNMANQAALGFADRRIALLAPAAGIAGAFAYAVVVRIIPALHSTSSVLLLVGANAALGASAHFAFHALRLEGGLPSWLARWARAIVLADAHASVVLMAFLWLAIADWI